MRRKDLKEKAYKFEEMWECEWCAIFISMTRSKITSDPIFPTDFLLAKVEDGSLFGYGQCDVVVLDKIKS